MTVRVIAYRDKPRAHLLSVSALPDPCMHRTVVYRPSAATDGGPQFCPTTSELEPYKQRQGDAKKRRACFGR